MWDYYIRTESNILVQKKMKKNNCYWDFLAFDIFGSFNVVLPVGNNRTAKNKIEDNQEANILSSAPLFIFISSVFQLLTDQN